MVARTGRGISPIVVIAALVAITGLSGTAFAYVLWKEVVVPGPADSTAPLPENAKDDETPRLAPDAPLAPEDYANNASPPPAATPTIPFNAPKAPLKNASATPPGQPENAPSGPVPTPTPPPIIVPAPAPPPPPTPPVAPPEVDSPVDASVDEPSAIQTVRDAPIPSAPVPPAPTPALATLG